MSNIIEFMGENYFITNGICKVTETNREGYNSGNINYGELHTEKVDSDDSDDDSDSEQSEWVDKESKKPIPFIFPAIIKDMYVDDLYVNDTDSWNGGYCPLEYVENIEEERHSSRYDEDDDYEDKCDVLRNRWRNGTFIMRINGEIHNVNMLVMLLQVEEIMEIVAYDRYMYLVKNTELTENNVLFDLLHITGEESVQRIFKGLRVILEKLWHAIMDDERKDIEIVKKLYRMMLLSYSITCSRIQRLATEITENKDISLDAKRKIISILYVVYKKLDNLKRLNMERILG
jgi:hypothetical protein